MAPRREIAGAVCQCAILLVSISARVAVGALLRADDDETNDPGIYVPRRLVF